MYNDSWLHAKSLMNNGYNAEVIKVYDDGYLDVKFENGIVREHVSLSSFRSGKLAFKSNYDLKQEANCKGLRLKMKNGQYATCISYRSNKDIDVMFDDKTVREHMTKVSFIHGDITNPNYNHHSMKDQVKKMNCGQYAICIADRGCNDIDIQFEDNTIVTTSRGNFRKGSVTNPSLGRGYSKKIKENYVGLEKYMNCGYKCKIIKCDNVYDTSVQFDDGTVVEHRYKSEFDRGTILHPKLGRLWVDGESIAQRLIYYYIRLNFSDAVYGIRPDWLKNPNTNHNFELDVYIPSLRVGIEFDGSVPSHMSKNNTNITKFNIIESSNMITKLYTILDKDERLVYFKSPKRTNIWLDYYSGDKRLMDLMEAINFILKDLGIDLCYTLDYNIVQMLYNKEDFLCLLEMK